MVALNWQVPLCPEDLGVIFPPAEEEWSVLWPRTGESEQSCFCLFVLFVRIIFYI